MSLREWLRAPGHLLVAFLGVTLVPAAGLGWLGWRLLEQDRALEIQSIQERLEHAADLVSAVLERHLTEVEQSLPALAASPPANPPDDAVIVAFDPRSVKAYPDSRLLYFPFVPSEQTPPPAVFREGETLEFQRRDLAKAIEAFRGLARSEDPAIRAGALLRLARNYRKAGRFREALDTYDKLALVGTVTLDGSPADLLARHARCAVLEALGRYDELHRAATELYTDLQRRRWRLDRPSFEFHAQAAQDWVDGQLPPDRDALALAAAVESLWMQYEGIRRGDGPVQGRRSLWSDDRPVLIMWRGTPDSMIALAAASPFFNSWGREICAASNAELALTDVDGRYVLGPPLQAKGPVAVRNTLDTGLPWTLKITTADPDLEAARLTGRRRLLLAGLAMICLLVVGGSYIIGRAAAREIAVAGLQSDFVSAVSHEFRTPLTSMRHLTELLEDGVVTGEERRRQYYSLLSRETVRLHRLVESLLNFGRMEAGRQEYRFERIELAALVEQIVAEFQNEVDASGYRIEIEVNVEHGLTCQADHEALGRALWNLLDNAVKYSQESRTIWVNVDRENGRVAVSVRDRGPGIPPAEQDAIFRKFVRGGASGDANVKGTGIGLAMVKHIVEAHGGEIRLRSELGRGSTFTVLLPANGEAT